MLSLTAMVTAVPAAMSTVQLGVPKPHRVSRPRESRGCCRERKRGSDVRDRAGGLLFRKVLKGSRASLALNTATRAMERRRGRGKRLRQYHTRRNLVQRSGEAGAGGVIEG